MNRPAARTEALPQQPPHPWQLRQATRLLRAGAVIAYPTEAVYGLGCDPLNAQAVLRLLALKGRPIEAGLILIAADFNQVEPFLEPLTAALRRKVFATWPGPVTWLLPARPDVPIWLRGRHDSLAVRITAHAGSIALCRAFGGPLISTSANPRGRAPARTPLQIRRYFGAAVDFLLPGPLGARVRPSEIRDARTGRVLRNG
ncbi:MAG: Sua5/YciO/YrdC/YwlC family protein [Gammaproteobacteria bacterium]|nr:Sua5/YciO/YrdC/YwlC family protein [Gammaproteobacteria bacterium]